MGWSDSCRRFSLIKVNQARLWDSLMDMAEIGATAGGGSCRLTMTENDVAGRRLFMHWCVDAGCHVYTDEIGNIFARYGGTDAQAAPVLFGSHLDTQPLGGRFDGVYGVLAGLEVIRTFRELGLTPRYPLEVVAWTNEEGSRFTPGMLGSAVYAGRVDLEFARSRRCPDTGALLGDELDRHGFSNTPPFRARPRAYYEAHIEQGPILERAAVPLGVVTGVQGLYTYDVSLQGFGCHAGTTPMHGRRDALVCAARIIAALSDMGVQANAAARVTVGKIMCEPNSPSTIPARVSFHIDIRHPDPATLAELAQRAVGTCKTQARAGQIGLELTRVASNAPVQFAPDCVQRVRQACAALGLPSLDMISGAGHDAVNLSYVAPSAMIFVPCKDGLSHNEAEYAAPEQLAQGASVLAHVVAAEAEAA